MRVSDPWQRGIDAPARKRGRSGRRVAAFSLDRKIVLHRIHSKLRIDGNGGGLCRPPGTASRWGS